MSTETQNNALESAEPILRIGTDSNGELAIFTPRFNSVIARFTPCGKSGMKEGLLYAAPVAAQAQPDLIRFDYVNADGQLDSKMITHDEMRARYAGLAQQPVSGADLPEGWREQFKTELYERYCAMDNQDCPLEDYPSVALEVLGEVVGPRHPAVVAWRNDAIKACIDIAYKYCRDPDSFQYLKQDLQALMTAFPEAQQPVSGADGLTDTAIETLAKQYDCHNAPGFKGFALAVASLARIYTNAALAQQDADKVDALERAVAGLKRYNYGYTDDGFGGPRYLGTIESPDGRFLIRDDVLAAIDAARKELA
ncbi:hypothetical protein [Alcaligenes aquatilis]|uniref:Uncharacterized protein n=1 Tax=Alcaligenes aquatilis TaxID=323284 RepID=A0A3G2HX36_9BURK|nr:hypothetical protein [Alcaligenes aquatilis]AYN21623.1 hypothetical protein D3M96_14435 [Alcaligenes aquatilis]